MPLPAAAVGSYRHKVSVSNPGGAIPDGDGGYTYGFTPADPPIVDASIQAAATRDLERVTGGTVLATATHLIRCRFHPGISVKTRLGFKGRSFEVQSVQNVDQRDIALILICAEVVDTSSSTSSVAGASTSPPAHTRPPEPRAPIVRNWA